MQARIRFGRLQIAWAPRLAGVLLAAFLAVPASGATVYVDDDPNACTPKNGSPACPFTTIQAGIDAAAVGDVVQVLPGVYLEKILVKNGVDVVSRDGPGVTTIDATGQAFSAVRFSNTVAGSTLVSRLSGFTITGGSGRPRSSASRGGAPGAVAGGGIFVYNRNQSVAAPIIDHNVITGNVLSTAAPSSYPQPLGAGVYVGVGRPQISHNVISGNTAQRVQGQNRFGWGGGLYAGYYGRPVVAHNTITANLAGVGGGGVALYGNPRYADKPEVNANLIQGNTANGLGGGILAGSYSDIALTNNVIRANQAGQAGGGIYTFYGSASIRNNTVVANTAPTTGGIWVGKSFVGNTVALSNNIITQNVSSGGVFAGGIRALTGGSALGTISFTFNDLVGNTPSDFGGIPDPALSPGNIALAPVFVNAAGGNYRLQPGSPGIDVASDLLAPPADFDGEPRPLDGTGDNVAISDMGAFELLLDTDGDGVPDDGSRSGSWLDAPCTGGATAGCDDNCRTLANALQEDGDADGRGNACDACPADPLNDQDADGVCGNADNCPAVSNPGQQDQDGDGLGNACDPDMDGDAVPNGSDCAPLVNSVDAAPGPVAGPSVLDAAGTLAWPDERQSNVYDVYRSSRPAGQAFAYAFACVAAELPGVQFLDPVGPAARGVFYYLIAGTNSCGDGPLGTASGGQPIPPPSSPCGHPGLDTDLDTVADRDDNCPLLVNLPQADVDRDGQGDVCDQDADGDGVGNASDCAPLDSSASAPPTGIGPSLLLGADAATLAWAADPTAPSYQVFRGELGPGAPFDYSYDCLAAVSPAATLQDPASPAQPRARFYYLVASRNACGSSGTGTDSSGSPRPAPLPCP